MATIVISDLHLSGVELFSDSESYLNEVSDRELNGLKGGFTPLGGTPFPPLPSADK